MSNMDISHSVVGTSNTDAYTDLTKNTDFYDSPNNSGDGVTGEETSYTCNWAKWHGYYEDIAIFAEVIDTLACWSVGRGFKGKDAEKLRKITGWGKDDANSIFENLLRVCLCGGDSHAEIIRDKAGRLTNLKPLNPGTIKQIGNPSGILDRYEQEINKKKIGDPIIPKKMFHLSWARLADEIHGKSYANREEPIIKQIKQLLEDLGLRFHRIVKPIRLYEADTDDETVLAAQEVKLKNAYKNCDIIVIPKGTMSMIKTDAIPSAEDAIEYLNTLIRFFVTSCGVPEIIMGWGTNNTTDASKIVYLAYQQRIERIQRFLEEQIRLQLGLEINFEFPASLEPALTTAGGNIDNSGKVVTPKESMKKDTKLNLKPASATKDEK